MRKYRLLIVLLLLVIVPVGFFTKFYSGPAQAWVSDSLGGLFYEIFWCLVVAFILPLVRPFKIALWVLFFTCTLEFMQLWHLPILDWLRSTFIGVTILGNSFNRMDFPYYVLGCGIGWYFLYLLKKFSNPDQNTSS